MKKIILRIGIDSDWEASIKEMASVKPSKTGKYWAVIYNERLFPDPHVTELLYIANETSNVDSRLTNIKPDDFFYLPGSISLNLLPTGWYDVSDDVVFTFFGNEFIYGWFDKPDITMIYEVTDVPQ